MARKRKRGGLRRMVKLGTGVLVAASVAQELRKSPERRTWEGRVVGVPYDYRMPTLARMRATWWAPDDARIVMPKAFGLGWDLNAGRIVRLATQALAAGK